MSHTKLKIEIADTPFSREKGLMFRKKLPEDEGMLFQFDKPQKLKFWGLNTFIPLSIAFVSDDKIKKIDSISPLSLKCVDSDDECSIAIEANHNFFDKNNIGVGSRIEIIEEKLQEYVLFKKGENNEDYTSRN